MYDVVIIGGGPAGLSAALVLGRCRRRVLVCDSGEYRNAASHGLHAFLTAMASSPRTCDGSGVRRSCATASKCERPRWTTSRADADRFAITLAGEQLVSRTLLIATGVVDRIPELAGIEDLYGRSVFHCPYGVALHEGRVARLEGDGGVLRRIVYHVAEVLDRRFMFFTTGHDQRSDLVARLGGEFDDKGAVKTNSLTGTRMAALYVLGDASQDMQLAIVAGRIPPRPGDCVSATSCL